MSHLQSLLFIFFDAMEASCIADDYHGLPGWLLAETRNPEPET
jgi:hypothetical protein